MTTETVSRRIIMSQGPDKRPPLAIRSAFPPLSARVRIGELRVSQVCIATVSTPATIGAAFDAGINFFLVASDMHWRNYNASRRGLDLLLRRPGFRRSDVIIASVSYTGLPGFSAAPFRELLEEIPIIGHLDITIMGGCDDASFVARRHEYEKHRTSFGSKANGAVFHNGETAAWCANKNLVDLVIVPFGVRRRAEGEAVLPFLSSPRAPVFALGSTLEYVTAAESVNLGVPTDKWIPSPGDYVRYALTHVGVEGVVLHVNDETSVNNIENVFRDGALDENEVAYVNDLADVADGKARVATNGSD